jgi:acetyl esterase/lipase
MKKLVPILTYITSLLSIFPFMRSNNRSTNVLLWVPKIFAGAFSSITILICGLGSVLGVFRRDWKLAGAGALGLNLAARYIRTIPDSQDLFADAFGPDWQDQISQERRSQLPSQRWSPVRIPPGGAVFQQNLVVGQSIKNGRPLLADLWQPNPETPCSGLGLIYAHGSGWRIGDKDLGTRTFFRHLTGQGHVVLDLAYTLWPQADIKDMVGEVFQAIYWLKENSSDYGVNPERIVLMGGSAGGQLALTAAYAPNHLAFIPSTDAGDTSVHGVIAFYPPVDFLAQNFEIQEQLMKKPNVIDNAAINFITSLFMMRSEYFKGDNKGDLETPNYISMIIGTDPEEDPELYQLLSPINHVGPHCPPTLILQGSDDCLVSAETVRKMHQKLQAEGVPSVMVEFSYTEHGFDLVFPQISPVAQAALNDVEHFLALLV